MAKDLWTPLVGPVIIKFEFIMRQMFCIPKEKQNEKMEEKTKFQKKKHNKRVKLVHCSIFSLAEFVK